jgi:hypothetical protein
MRSGIVDPLRTLPDMHSVLNFVEVLLPDYLEPERLKELQREMYRRETIDTQSGELKAVPAGFTPEDELASFDAFAAIAGDG